MYVVYPVSQEIICTITNIDLLYDKYFDAENMASALCYMN
jgi:hypothetical protein